MSTLDQSPTPPAFCQHAANHRLAVVSLGNPLRGDDGIAAQLISMLPAELLGNLCLLHAGGYTGDLAQFLDGHDRAILVDAAQGEPHLTVVALQAPHFQSTVKLNCCHGMSFLDELALQANQYKLPERIVLAAVPIYETAWGEGLSLRLKERLGELCAQLQLLIESESTCTKLP